MGVGLWRERIDEGLTVQVGPGFGSRIGFKRLGFRPNKIKTKKTITTR